MSHTNHLLLWVLLSCCLGAALGSIEFIAYGVSSGDLQLTPDSASSSAELSLDMPIIYYGRTFNSVFVSSCGVHELLLLHASVCMHLVQPYTAS